MRRNLSDFVRHFALGVPEVVSPLHVEPNLGAVAAELAEAQRHGGRDGDRLGKNAVQRLPADAESLWRPS